MNWNTIYIKGKAGFEKEVLNKLNHSPIPFMPGYTSEQDNVSLFWLDDHTTLRDFKKAIGSKLIFKFRLQFYSSMEEATRDTDESDSSDEDLKIVA